MHVYVPLCVRAHDCSVSPNSGFLVNHEWRSIVHVRDRTSFREIRFLRYRRIKRQGERERERDGERGSSIDSNIENDNALHNKCERNAWWGKLPATYAIDLLDSAMCVTRIKDRQTPALIQLI